MRVLLASSSPSERSRLAERLQKMDGITVSAKVNTLSEAYQSCEHRPPNAVVLGEDQAHRPESEVLFALLRALRVRVVILRDRNFRFRKPATALRGHEAIILDEDQSDVDFRAALMGARGGGKRPVRPALRQQAPPAQATPRVNPNRIIMLGSSTGGVEALLEVLSNFGPDSPPVFMVQHTGGFFSSGLARLLNGRSPVRVSEASDGLVVKPGMAVLAPGATHHLHLKMRGAQPICRLVEAPEICGHRPSVDALFRSGVPAASKIVAAILTGMGRDGAAGLLELRQAGARTFGQDKETSLVYGMPKVAAEMRALEKQLPIKKIGPALIAASSEKSAA